jgi:hypothetical protein
MAGESGITSDSLYDYPGDVSLESIVKDMQESWDSFDLKNVRIVKVKNTDIKSIKQTLELV